MTGFKDVKLFMEFVQNTILSQYIQHLTASSERKEMITSSWEGHIVRLVELRENTRFGFLGVEAMQDFVQPNESSVNEHLHDVQSRFNKKQNAAVKGSSFPIKITEEKYRDVSRSNQIVCIYTSTKLDRPWFALVTELLDLQISVRWYRRVRSSPSRWELTDEADLVYYGSVMLWDFTQDVTEDFGEINVTKEILIEVKEAYKSLDEQFSVKERAVYSRKKESCDNMEVLDSSIDGEKEPRQDENSEEGEDGEISSIGDGNEVENSRAEQDITDGESDSESIVVEEKSLMFDEKAKHIDDQIDKLRQDDLNFRLWLKEKDKQRESLLKKISL